MPDDIEGTKDEGQKDDQGSPDLSNPAVQSAINSAVQKALQANNAKWESELEGLKKNRDDILAEKKTVQERLEALETKAGADAAGVDTEKFEQEVEKRADLKFQSKAKELKDILEERNTKIEELTQSLEQEKTEKQRLFVMKELYSAAMPEDTKIVHDGAWPYLVDRAMKIIEPQEIDGMPDPVGRVKVNGTFVPGEGPDNLMSPRELLSLGREGKGPLADMGFAFVSAGRGSDRKTPGGKASSKAWSEMSPEEQSSFVNEHGHEKAQDLISQELESQQKKTAVQ